jgi:hypothetical protein
MLISVASERSKKFRSVGNFINDVNSKVTGIQKVLPTSTIGDNAVSTDSISGNSVTGDLLATQSISADKLDLGSSNSANSNQRVPAPLNSIDYWTPVLKGSVATHTEPYFNDVQIRNVSVGSDGLTLSPERLAPFPILTYELAPSGVVTITTDGNHGYEIGDVIHINALGSPFDGEWVITSLPSTSSMCYYLGQFSQAEVYYKVGEQVGGSIKMGPTFTQQIVGHSCIDGVITLSLRNASDGIIDDFAGHGIAVGSIINVSGLGSPYDGLQIVTDVPEDQPTILRYGLIGDEISTANTAISLNTAIGDGTNVTYTLDPSSIYAESPVDFKVSDQVKVYGFTDTGYNISGPISQVGTNSFAVPSTYVGGDGNTEATAGSPRVIFAHVKVDAEARVFLTGKNNVPTSRVLTVSWMSDNNPLNMYLCYWVASNSGVNTPPRLVLVDHKVSESISKLPGTNNYYWEIPEEASHYALLAEVLPGSDPVVLKECYVFESVGDQDKKTEHITAISVSNNIATVYTATTHSFSVGESVVMYGVQAADLLSVYKITNVVSDGSNVTYTANNSYTAGDLVDIVNTTESNTVVNGYSTFDMTGAVVAFANTTHFKVTSPITSTYINGGVTYKSHTPLEEYKFQVQSIANDATYFTITTTGLPNTNGNVSLSGTVLGGQDKHQTTTVAPSGFVITGSDGSQTVNLTEDYNDNYLAITTAENQSAVNMSNDGKVTIGSDFSASGDITTVAGNVEAINSTFAGVVTSNVVTTNTINSTTVNTSSITSNVITANTFSTNALTATSLTVAGTNLIPTVIGTFANANYNGSTSYTGAYFDRLARGVVYQSYWNIPTINVPTSTTYFGLAYGTVTLEEDRAYQIFVDTSGIKYSPNTNVNLDLLMSDQPIALGAPDILIRMSQSLRANAAAYTILNQNFADMSGYFQTLPKTGSTFTNSVTTNLTSATISSWSKGTGSPVVSVTLSNSTPLTYYLKTGDYVAISNIVSVNASESLLYNGTFQITKTSGNTFTYTSGSSALSTSNSAGTVVLVEPQMVNTNASFTEFTIAVATPNTVTYPMRNYFVPGQKVSVSGFSGGNTNFNVQDAYVTASNAVSFTVSSTSVGLNTSACVNATVLWTSNQLQVNKTVLPSKTPLYWILRLRHDIATTSNVAFTTIGNPQGAVIVTDLGQAKTLSYAAPNIASGTEWTSAYAFPPGLLAGGGTYTPPSTNANVTATVTNVVTTNVVTVTSSGSAYYDNYGKGDSGTSDPYANQQSLYQGNPGTASGTKKSQVVFSSYTLPTPSAPNANVTISGTTVTKVEVYLRNRHSYYSTGLTTKIGISTGTSLGSSITTSGVTAGPTVTSTTFTKGQGKWVALGSGTYTYANAGTLRSILISLTDQNPITYDSTLANYGYFDGDLQTDPPKLRITYTYTTSTTTYS